MRDLTSKDIEFLNELQAKTKGTDNGSILINDKESLNKLIILLSSVNWNNIVSHGIFQKAADRVHEFMEVQTTVRTMENTYVSTRHPYEISRIAHANGRIRITIAMDVPDKESKMQIKRHICLVYETQTDAIYPG